MSATDRSPPPAPPSTSDALSDALSDPFDFSPRRTAATSSPKSWKTLLVGGALSLSPFSRSSKLPESESGDTEPVVARDVDTMTLASVSSTTTTAEEGGPDDGTEEWEKRQQERYKKREQRKRERAARSARPTPVAPVAAEPPKEDLARFRINPAADDLFEKHLRRIQEREDLRATTSQDHESDVEEPPTVKSPPPKPSTTSTSSHSLKHSPDAPMSKPASPPKSPPGNTPKPAKPHTSPKNDVFFEAPSSPPSTAVLLPDEPPRVPPTVSKPSPRTSTDSPDGERRKPSHSFTEVPALSDQELHTFLGRPLAPTSSSDSDNAEVTPATDATSRAEAFAAHTAQEHSRLQEIIDRGSLDNSSSFLADGLVDRDRDRADTPRPSQETDWRNPLFHEENGVFFPLRSKEQLSEEERVWVERTRVVPSQHRGRARTGVSIGLPGQWGSHILSPLAAETEPPSSSRSSSPALSPLTSPPLVPLPVSPTLSKKSLDLRFSPHQSLAPLVATTTSTNTSTPDSPSRPLQKTPLTRAALESLHKPPTSPSPSSPKSNPSSPSRSNTSSPRDSKLVAVVAALQPPERIKSPTPFGLGHLRLDSFSLDAPSVSALPDEPTQDVEEPRRKTIVELFPNLAAPPPPSQESSTSSFTSQDTNTTTTTSASNHSPRTSTRSPKKSPPSDLASAHLNLQRAELAKRQRLMDDHFRSISPKPPSAPSSSSPVVEETNDEPPPLPLQREAKWAGVRAQMRQSTPPPKVVTEDEKAEQRKLREFGRSPDYGKAFSETKAGERDAHWKLAQVFANEKRKLKDRQYYYPQDERILNDLASLHLAQPVPELQARAAGYWQQSLEIRKSQPRIWYALGHFHLERGDFPAAVDALQHAIKHDPNSARSHLDLGVALTLAKYPSLHAQTVLKEAISLDQHGSVGAEAWFQRGRIFEATGVEWRKASECFEKALKVREMAKASRENAPLRGKEEMIDRADNAKREMRKAERARKDASETASTVDNNRTSSIVDGVMPPSSSPARRSTTSPSNPARTTASPKPPTTFPSSKSSPPPPPLRCHSTPPPSALGLVAAILATTDNDDGVSSMPGAMPQYRAPSPSMRSVEVQAGGPRAHRAFRSIDVQTSPRMEMLATAPPTSPLQAYLPAIDNAIRLLQSKVERSSDAHHRAASSHQLADLFFTLASSFAEQSNAEEKHQQEIADALKGVGGELSTLSQRLVETATRMAQRPAEVKPPATVNEDAEVDVRGLLKLRERVQREVTGGW